MKTRFEIWEEKISELAEVVGYDDAYLTSERMTDEYLGISRLDGRIEEEAKLIDEVVNLEDDEVLGRLSEEQFKELIDSLEYCINIELEIIEDAKKERGEEREGRDLIIYERERELCFYHDLSRRQAQVVARREVGMTNDQIAEEFGISKQSASDAYRIGIQKLSIMQNEENAKK